MIYVSVYNQEESFLMPNVVRKAHKRSLGKLMKNWDYDQMKIGYYRNGSRDAQYLLA